MRTIKKTIIVSALVVTVLGTSFFASSHAFAQETQGQTLAQVIADRFHLNANDVQSTITKYRADHKTMIQAKFKALLDQDVKDGKLTSEQEQSLLTELQKLQSERQNQNLQNMTWSQRRAFMQSQSQELQNWAQQNGVNLPNLFKGFGKRMVWMGK